DYFPGRTRCRRPPSHHLPLTTHYLGLPLGGGQRPGHDGGNPATHLRAVLLDARARTGAGSSRGPPDHHEFRRPCRCPERTRPRNVPRRVAAPVRVSNPLTGSRIRLRHLLASRRVSTEQGEISTSKSQIRNYTGGKIV